MSELIDNIDKLHTTPMGAERIERNLGFNKSSVVERCKDAVMNADLIVLLKKNWYVYYHGAVITVNAKSFTIITAHKI